MLPSSLTLTTHGPVEPVGGAHAQHAVDQKVQEENLVMVFYSLGTRELCYSQAI